MPTTTTAVIIVILAVLPGLLGNRIYQGLVGVHWREKEWQSILRLVAFSTAGATIYALASEWLHLPPVVHLMPAVYQEAGNNVASLNRVFPPYAGHLTGGALAGLLAAFGEMFLGRFSSRSAFPSAWDDFVRTYAGNRWVIAGLQNGEVYAGILANADISVPTGERDLVLAEPCVFTPQTNNYTALNYQYLFIPAANLYSIAGIHEPNDPRLIKVGQSLFEEKLSDDEQKTANAATPPTRAKRDSRRMAAKTTDCEAPRPSTSPTADTQEKLGGE